jgi:hypothetical protein
MLLKKGWSFMFQKNLLSMAVNNKKKQDWKVTDSWGCPSLRAA